MAKNRTYLVALIIIVAAGLTMYLKSRDGGNSIKTLLQNFEPESLTQFTIQKDGEKAIKIEKDLDLKKWVLVSEQTINPLIDVKKVVSLMDFLQDTNVLSRVTKKSENYSKYEVTEKKGIRIELKRSNMDPVVLFLGKTNDKRRQFVRKQKDPYVYLLANQFEPDWTLENWYFKNILKWPLESLREVQYSTKKRKILPLIFDSNSKKLVTTSEAPKNKRPKDLKDIFDGLNNLSVKKFVKKADSPKTIKQISHNLLFQDGTKLELQFLKKKKGKTADADQFFLKIDTTGPDSQMKKYLSAMSEQYLFEINGFNEGQFAKAFDAFYEDIPKPKEITKPEVKAAQEAPKK